MKGILVESVLVQFAHKVFLIKSKLVKICTTKREKIGKKKKRHQVWR